MEEQRKWSLIAPADNAARSPSDTVSARIGRQRATTACSECQTRKIKCNGEFPCASCVSKKLHCVFDRDRDQRRKVGVKRKFEELETENANLKTSLQETREELRQALQKSNHLTGSAPSDKPEDKSEDSSIWGTPQVYSASLPNDGVPDTYTTAEAFSAGQQVSDSELQDEISSLQAIYHAICGCAPGSQSKVSETIRNCASSKEALDLLTENSLNVATPPTDNMSSVGTVPHLFGMGNSPAQSIRPTANVPAKPWTTITDDDELVSHLVSLYFCWDYPVHCFFDKELFLADMAAGRDQFCSKLLVNALLSVACLYAHSLEKPWDRRYELGMSVRFLVEAHHLKIADGESRSLTAIQGLIMMNITYNCLGKDDIGSQCLESAVQMAIDLGLFQQSPSSTAETLLHDKGLGLARAVTAWGLFDWQAFFAASMNKPPLLLEPPTIDFPYKTSAWAGQEEKWHAYPKAGPLYPSMICSTFNARVALSGIVCKLMMVSHGNAPQEKKPGSLDSLHSELQDWMRVYGLQVNPSTNPVAHVIMLHLYYHIKIVKLCNSSSLTAAPVNFDISQSSDNAKSAIRELVFLYRQTFGWRSASNFLSHALTYTAYFTIPHVLHGDARWRACLETCINGLWHLSFAFPVCQYILRAIHYALDNAGIKSEDLPGDGGKFLTYFANKVWKKSSLEYLESQYAIPYLSETDPRSLKILLLSLEGLSMQNENVIP